MSSTDPKTSEKIWKILPEISDNFLKQYPEYSRLVLQLLFNRGIIEKKEIDLFFASDYETDGFDPCLFKDMAKAIELIISHIRQKNKIIVYGDYDADGVTAAAVLFEVLKTLKAEVDVYIPDRVSEGYGLNKKAIDEIAGMGAKLIITVDGGIKSKDEVEHAKKSGLEVIITDHHIAPEKQEDLPDCLIINPAVIGETYPFKFLAGVGVSFKVAKALISRSKLTDEQKRALENKVIDLVAIGTVADCVTTLGENRLLIKKGLEILNLRKRIGLEELMNVAQINAVKKLDSWNIGFQIAPRLNAAGRMDHANTAFEILITGDREEAMNLSNKLNEKNGDRQKVTEEITAAVDAQVDPDDKIIIGVCPETVENESWKEGVVGLVAGRITEKYYRPTLVITRSSEGLKGSGRSIEEFNIVEALSEAKDFVKKYGGHPSACGFSLAPEQLAGFKAKMKEIADRKLAGLDLRPKIKIEAKLELREVNRQLVDDLVKFGPFGQNNDKPKLASYGVEIVDINQMGLDGQHIKLKLKSDGSNIIFAIGFGQAEKWSGLKIGDKIDIVYYAETNDFNGRTETQLKIIDIKILQ